MIKIIYDAVTKTETFVELPDETDLEPISQPPTIDQRVGAGETDVDDIITVLAVMEGII